MGALVVGTPSAHEPHYGTTTVAPGTSFVSFLCTLMQPLAIALNSTMPSMTFVILDMATSLTVADAEGVPFFGAASARAID
jgi:hypothetical protein